MARLRDCCYVVYCTVHMSSLHCKPVGQVTLIALEIRHYLVQHPQIPGASFIAVRGEGERSGVGAAARTDVGTEHPEGTALPQDPFSSQVHGSTQEAFRAGLLWGFVF